MFCLELSWYVWLMRSSYHVPDCIVETMQEILENLNQARRKYIPFTHGVDRGR